MVVWAFRNRHATRESRADRLLPLEGAGALPGLPVFCSAVGRLIEDVLRHFGHALQDDVATLLIRSGTVTRSGAASRSSAWAVRSP